MGWDAIGVQREEVRSESSHMLIDLGVLVDTKDGGRDGVRSNELLRSI